MSPKHSRSGEYARRKAKCLQFNLCIRCLQPKGQNRWKCNVCLEKDNIKDFERRHIHTSNGLCGCGRPPISTMKMCEVCQEEARLSQERRREKHRLTGKCLTCGADPVSGQMTCEACNGRATAATLKRYRTNILNVKCAFCGGKLDHSTFRCNDCHKQHTLRGKVYWNQKRLLVLDHYGNKCQCCGVHHTEFLDVDHINGGGTKHRRTVGRHFNDWIINNNFPADLQLLCANCNYGKGKFGVCPHHQEPQLPSSSKAKTDRSRRQLVIAQYGGKCQCCQETNWAFLEFDHIHNDGASHRQNLTTTIVSWIIANNYPDTIQLLCSNCNKAKGLYGTCPHLVQEQFAS